MMRSFKQLGLSMILVAILASGIGNSTQTGLAQNCTITVKPGESIQKAIDAATSGAVICLTAGTWKEMLKIAKGLTVHGAARDQTELNGTIIVSVESQQSSEVTLDNLTITGQPDSYGLRISGTTHVSIDSFLISFPSLGVIVENSARTIISNSQITRNLDKSIWVRDFAQVTLISSKVSKSQWIGLWVQDSAQATLINTEVSESQGTAIVEKNAAKVHLINSQVLGNWGAGVWSEDLTQMIGVGSKISDNGGAGLRLFDSAEATLTSSEISSNDWQGIYVSSDSLAVLKDNIFRQNGHCGIEAEGLVYGSANLMKDNGVDLCGNLSPELRKPLVPQTNRTQLKVPDDYATLQEAVDAIADGGMVTIAVGAQQGGVTIAKQLTIKGTDRSSVILKGRTTDVPVISLISGALARLENLTISNGGFGIQAWGRAHVTATDCEISNNQYGINARNSTQIYVNNCQVQNNRSSGIFITDSVMMTLTNSTLTGNEYDGLQIESAATTTITNVRISSNLADGIFMGGSVHVVFQNVQISNNGLNGLWMTKAATLEAYQSTIESNGTRPDCQKPGLNSFDICNGILVGGESHAAIVDSKLLNNTDWGIATWLKKCQYDSDAFIGKVEFKGNNVIHGNNKPGNQNGMGNPGNHPWNRPDVADGQVCLP